MDRNVVFNNSKSVLEAVVERIIENLNSTNSNGNEENNFCLDGAWGSGKTKVLNDMQKIFEEKSSGKFKYEMHLINVWQHEISNYPMHSIIWEMVNILGINGEKFWKKLVNALGTIDVNINASLGVVAPMPYVDLKAGVKVQASVKRAVKKYREGKFEYFNSTDKDRIEKLISSINEVISNLDKKIIIAFDELDRCSLEMQIKFINVLKNIIFRLNKNIYFIVSANAKALNDALEIEGEEPYLNKIFDDTLNIKILNKEWDENKEYNIRNNEYIKYLIEKCDINYRIQNTIFEKMEKMGSDVVKILNNINSADEIKNNAINLSIIFVILYYKYNNPSLFNKILNEWIINNLELNLLKTNYLTYDYKADLDYKQFQSLEGDCLSKTFIIKQSRNFINAFGHTVEKDSEFYLFFNFYNFKPFFKTEYFDVKKQFIGNEKYWENILEKEFFILFNKIGNDYIFTNIHDYYIVFNWDVMKYILL